MSIYRGAGGASDATDDSTVNAVAGYAADAAASATSAANSATDAATSAGAAATSASGAATQVSLATAQASNAASSASSAASSVTSAAAQASAASTSASAASSSASGASTSASAASTSATNAATSATAASGSATTAATQATNSAASAASALAIYGNTTAMNNAVTASQTAATNAATSAASAATSAADALASSADASVYADNANTSYVAAAASAAAAAATVASFNGNVAVAVSSAAAASASASAAASSATNSANSATQAAASAAGATAIVTGVASTRASIRPSLLLDFANTRVLDPRITFTRASTATFYDPTSSAVAEQNLLLQSQTFDNASWLKTQATVTSNSTTAPDGTTTADTLLDNTAASTYHLIKQTSSFASGTTYVFSCYAKNNDGQYVCLSAQTGISSYAGTTFDTINGTLNSGQSGSGWSVAASMTSVGSGWYRCIAIITSGSTASAEIQISRTNSASAPSSYGMTPYTGSGQSVYLWGAQLEQRSTATAYTPTTTAAITNYIPVLQTAASGVARFNCNPVTRESLGLLIEEARTNLLTYSSDFSNAAWTKSAVTVTGTINIAPDGSQTASLVSDTAATSSFLLAGSATLITTTAYTFSVYAKAQSNSLIQLTFDRVSSNNYANFNLSTGVISKLGANSTAVISPAGNGWYKCSVTATTVNGGAGSAKVYLINDANSVQAPSYTGTGLLSVFLWGAQLEAGAFATSYIPTVASQVTRAADSASMTGTNFSSWYNQSQGTMYASGPFVTPTTVNSAFFALGSGIDNTANTYFLVGAASGTGTRVRLLGYDAAETDVIDIYPATTFTNNQFVQAAFAYAPNDYALSLNGAAPSFDVVGHVPAPFDRLVIGAGLSTSAYQRNSTIKRLAYYPMRLSNTELQGLTS